MTDFVLNTAAFPPLHAFKKTYQNSQYIHHHLSNHQPINSISSNTSSSSSNSCFFFNALAPPKYPSYLKLTNYSTLVTEQYQHLQKKKRSRCISNIEYNRDLEEIDFRLPQFWNKNDKSRLLEVGLNGLDITYQSPNYHHPVVNNNNNNNNNESRHFIQKPMESAAIRTNFPTRPQCGIYYFEITVLSNGQSGLYAVGFCTALTKLNKLPGYEADSFGYHSYNGMLYDHQHSKGIDYGPTFTSGDTIGCGINFSHETAFFTKNGVLLGTAFTEISHQKEYYPCIGLGSPQEKITANFGHEPFLFDIAQYIKDQQKEIITQVTHTQQEITNMDDLILAYLTHQGYVETVNALEKNMVYVKKQHNNPPIEDETIKNHARIEIRRAVMSGHIDEAMEQTETMYPHLLDTHPDLLFKLKARKFLDIMLEDEEDIHSTPVLAEDEEGDTASVSSSFEEPPVRASGRRLSWAAVAATTTTPDTEEIGGKRRLLSYSLGRRNSGISLANSEEGTKKLQVLRKAIEYGQELQEEYQDSPKYLDQLMDMFGLLSFTEPKLSPLAHMLDKSLRDTVASDLNNAIQEYEHHNAVSNLESLFKQSVVTTKELALYGHGKSSLIPVQDFYLCK